MAKGYQGQLQPGQDGGDFGTQIFLISQVLKRVNVCELVRVIEVHPFGMEPDPDGLFMIGTVDVQPLVSLMSSDGLTIIPHNIIYNVPYFRLQAGGSAIILDPAVGDNGLAVFASRDMTVAKTTKEFSQPGSWSRFSMSDGFYFGGFINDLIPITQNVTLNAEGIGITSDVGINIGAPSITIVGEVAIVGSLTVNGNVIS
jgi:hypothetical protein